MAERTDADFNAIVVQLMPRDLANIRIIRNCRTL